MEVVFKSLSLGSFASISTLSGGVANVTDATNITNFGKEGKPEPVVPKISQEMLAEMIGTTRSRVSFFMNRFRELGFIHYNGGLQIHSSLLHVVLHD